MTSVSGDDSIRRPSDGRGTDDSNQPRSSSVSGASDAEDLYVDKPPPTRPTSRLGRRSSGRRKAEVTKQPLPAWLEMILLIATAMVLALIIKTFFIQAFYIPSGSMRDTLRVNDRILVEKWSYWFGDIQRGDIVVFDDPANWLGEEDANTSTNAITKTLSVIGLYPTGGHLVKRVIGVGGDEVECTRGVVEVNGVALKESDYVTLANKACTGSWDIQVPQDRLWVLGDNRNHSADSRAHIGDPGGGFIPVGDVVGKVFVVIWPLGHWGFVHRPGTFDNPALDQAASFISGTAPVGLALIGIPPVYRRFKNRITN